MIKKRQSVYSTNASTQKQLRIIAGSWRGRKLTFTQSQGLRPTPDRVRETLFNWLANTVIEARCLDLFAGSGALGLEALSRGAKHVDLIETASCTAKQLHQQLLLLKANNGKVWHEPAQQWLNRFNHHSQEPYDIVFIDPPFRKGMIEECITLLDNKSALAPGAWIYMEMSTDELLPVLPSWWSVYREKTAGQVCYRLIAT